MRLERRLLAVMFTDMVGYTALMQADEQAAVERRDRYVNAVQRHHDAFGGTIVQRLGDGTMSMFPSSLDAVLAAVEMQRELAADVQVRVGIHVGEVVVEPEQLTGDAVNIANRIESFAVPGGVMLSDTAYDQIKNRADVAVVGLGRFKLKSVGRPFELYAVAADGVVVPEPDAIEGKGERYASLPSNLPEPATPLVGRAADVAQLVDLTRQHRVVTITGPGGVGKTRTLVEAGRLLAPEFLDGVAFVPLADVTDPDDVVPAIAQTLDVKEAEERSLGDGIVALIGDRKALLLLDNLEQVVAAAPEVAELVARCPGLHVVITSRTPLRIAAEREYPLAPLEVDSAVALFAERAATAKGAFELTGENTEVVETLCRRLDGLPLALELAAARLRLLSPEALLERLDRALDVLTSGRRDSAERHQTLRATIDFSHSLLAEPEQRVFRRLAVFAGGCTLDDLEAVCGESCLDEVESLVDKALVQVDGDRLRMLQTIGDFARERLEAAGEAPEVAHRHAAQYAKVAREIRDGIEGTDQLPSVGRGIAEEANLHAALDSLLVAALGGDQAACETGMQLCGDLYMYWHIRGKNITAREYAEPFLAAHGDRVATGGRAAALVTAGLASLMTGELERATAEWSEAYEVASDVGAGHELCIAAVSLAIASLGVDTEAGLEWAKIAVEQSTTHGLDWALALSLTFEAMLLAIDGDPDAAVARYNEAFAIQERLGDLEGGGVALSGLAQLAAARGETVEALALYRRSRAWFEEIGDRAEEARVLSEMAGIHLENGDTSLARGYFFESVQAHTDLASVRGVGLALIGLAASEAVEGRPENAVRVAAAAEVYAQQEGIAVLYTDETPGREYVDRAEAQLSADDVARARDAGRRLTIKEALDLARAPQELSRDRSQ
jgi:predicted ATPase/class 3 adenylate cyclase